MRLNGWALRAIRVAQGRSGAECARAAGVSQPLWSNWERAVRDAPAHRILSAAAALDVDYRALLVDPTNDELDTLRRALEATAS